MAARAGRWLSLGLVLGLLAFPATAAAADEEPTEPTFTFSGGGYGHGTGMSQYGAQGQALEGRDWQTILSAGGVPASWGNLGRVTNHGARRWTTPWITTGV